MREILFRAKRCDNGEWAEGFLVKHPSAAHIGDYSPWYISVPPKDPEDSGGLYNADPETIGQYTGLADKNGKKIFEGDIVLTDWFFTDKLIPFYIAYKDGEFRATPKHITEAIWDIRICGEACAFEVAGNIHDNPELLKED